MRRHLFSPLQLGDTIGLVAPASPVYEPERRDAAVHLLEEMGFLVRRGISVDTIGVTCAETDSLRAHDLMNMFLDSHVRAVVCLRGGWGSIRLLPLLDYAAIARHPKPLVGFSDITALHTVLHNQCGFVTVHGPMPGAMEPIGLRDPASRAQWLNTLTGCIPRAMRNPNGTPFHAHGSQSVCGTLVGGNLSVLVALIGTPWEPCWDGALLLLEDVSERFDRLDSMFMQLKQHGVFDRINGLVLGDFSRYAGAANMQTPTFQNLITPYLPPLLPILWNVHAGHGRDRITLLLGAKYRLNPQSASLSLTEYPFRKRQTLTDQ